MLRGKGNKMHPIWRMMLLVATMLLCLFVLLSVYAMQGMQQDTASLKPLQAWQTVMLFIVPCLMCAYLWDEHPLHYLQLDKEVSWLPACSVVLLMLIALPGINLLSWCNQQLTLPSFLSGLEQWMQAQEENAAVLTERLVKADTVWVLLINVFVMAVLPALGEEICFRGVIQRLFQPMDREKMSKTAVHLSVWVAAILFSAMHFQFYGFVPRMLLGALFGYLLVWYGSLWLPILAHFVNNAVVVLAYNYYYMRGISTDEIDAFGTGDTLWVGVLSLVVTAVGVWGLSRVKRD